MKIISAALFVALCMTHGGVHAHSHASLTSSVKIDQVAGPLKSHNNEEKKKSARFASKQGLSRDLRGGAKVAIKVEVNNGLQKTLAGAAVMAAIEHLMKHVLKSLDIKFPAMLAGCLSLFAFLLIWEQINSKQAQQMSDFLTPGATLLAKWLPMFFVPGLALLPLAPSVGGNVEIVKVLLVVVLGLAYTILTVGATVMAFRGGNLKPGNTNIAKASKRATKKGMPVAKAKPFTLQQVKCFGTAAALAGALTIVSKGGEWNKLCETAFLTLFTVASYMWAARLPSNFVSVVHPLVSCCVLILLSVQVLSMITNRSFDGILRGYKVGSLLPKKAGSGDILLYLLGPSAVSFAISMFTKRELLIKNLPLICAAVMVSSVGGLFGTAAFVRAISLGGKSLNANTLRLSVLSRNVTTALALALTSMIGGDLALAAAVVCLTGVIGATYGKVFLDYCGIKDGITRGLCIGSSAQGLGVASMSDEGDAFPFAAIAMVLTAVTSTTLVTFPPVKQALVKLATGRKF